MTIPHWAPPTHAMQIFRYAEQGSIELLWISATNPAVSLPELARIRRILEREELFVVVQDLFLTETARFADVVLPGGHLGREDRHVHQRRPHRAPLRAGRRPARRGALRPRHLPRLRAPDGLPRPRRRAADQVARPRERRSRPGRRARAGRPCDYTGAHLRPAARRERHPVAVHRRAPDGTERLYTDGVFNTDPDYCEDLRPRPASPARRTARTSTGAKAAGRPGVPARRRLRAVAGDAAATSTRCCSPPAARSTTSTRAPRPAARRELNAAAPDVWVGAEPRGRRRARRSREGDLRRASSRRAARSRRRRASGASGRASSSFRSTTATGTDGDGTPRPPTS